MKVYDPRELPGAAVYKKKDVDSLVHAVKNLLAVIHRDGGHYTDENGIIKSCEDAEIKVMKERSNIENKT